MSLRLPFVCRPQLLSRGLLSGFGDKRLLDWKRIAFFKAGLVPVGVGHLGLAGGIELGYLLWRERPADAGEVGAELLPVARADDERGDGGTLEQPVERDLRNGFAGFFSDPVDRIDHFVDVFPVGNRAAFD